MGGGSIGTGWYPDPANPASKRWWDGTSWTGKVAPADGRQIERPPTPPPTSPGGDGSSSAHQAPNPRGFASTPSPWASNPATDRAPAPPPAAPAPYLPFTPYTAPSEPPLGPGSPFNQPIAPPSAGSPFNQPQGGGSAPNGIPGITGAAQFRPKPTFAQANQQSLLTMAVAAGYVGVALVAHIVFLGIVPFLAGIRAIQRGEPLAAPAMVVAVAFVGASFVYLR